MEKVEKEGAGATIPYVCVELPPVVQRSSSCRVFSGNLANHWPSRKAQVQLANLKML